MPDFKDLLGIFNRNRPEAQAHSSAATQEDQYSVCLNQSLLGYQAEERGAAHFKKGELNEALAEFTAARSVFCDLYGDYCAVTHRVDRSIAATYMDMADLTGDLHLYRLAERKLTPVVEAQRKFSAGINFDGNRYEAETVRMLARCCEFLGDDRAAVLHKEARDILERPSATLELGHFGAGGVNMPELVRTRPLYGQERSREEFIRLGTLGTAMLVETVGDSFHAAWQLIHRRERGEDAPRFKPTNDLEWVTRNRAALASGEPWIRSIETESGVKFEVDIAALKNSELPRDRQSENTIAGYIAVGLYLQALNRADEVNPGMIIAIADTVHRKWVERNQWIFDAEHDGKPDVECMRLSFREMFRRGTTDPVAAAEAVKDIESVQVAIMIVNDALKASVPEERLANALRSQLQLPVTA